MARRPTQVQGAGSGVAVEVGAVVAVVCVVVWAL